jgi:hypothetical protein
MRPLLFFATLAVLATATFSERLPNHELIRHSSAFKVSSPNNPPAIYKSARGLRHANSSKRADEEGGDTWADALCKGGTLLAAMAGSDADAGKLYKLERATGQSAFGHVLSKRPS